MSSWHVAVFAIPPFTHLPNSARASEVVALSTRLRKGRTFNTWHRVQSVLRQLWQG
jgi:hypothetical protein